MLRLAPLLVEAGFFETVNFIFYVVGHTKNAADRWFNSLKRVYRLSDIWTFDQLLEKMDTNKEHIRILTVDEGDFKHFKNFENKYYKMITAGKLLSCHIFTVNNSNPTTMIIRKDRLDRNRPHVVNLKKIDGNIRHIMANIIFAP